MGRVTERFMALSNVTISFIFPYSCWLFSMCSANADCEFIALNVSYVFLVPLLQIPACLSYISMFACFARECVNSAEFVVLDFVVVAGFGEL
jgi:hypothetical protein